jgi:RNA polymerase sigma factor (sigma-70 family)
MRKLRRQKMDNKELEKIYNDTYRSVYWTAMSLLKNEEDAQDIVQETYVTLIDSYDTLKDKEKAAAWLKKTAANKCLDHLRRTRTVNVEDEFFEEVEAQPEDFLPDSILESAEKRKVIMDIIDNALSEDVRRTLILYYYDEMTTKEIASLLGIPQGTVLWRLNFAKKKIKKEVEKYEKDNDYKLYAMGLPFLSKLFAKEAEQVPLKQISASLLNLSASADVPAKSATAKAAASSAATKGIAGLTINKLIIAIVSLILVLVAIALVINYVMKDPAETAEQSVVSQADESEGAVTDGTSEETALTSVSPDHTGETSVNTSPNETVAGVSAAATTSSADPASALIGTWTGTDARSTVYMTINADGTMEVLLVDNAGVELERQNYTYTMDGYEMVWTYGTQTAHVSYTLDGDTLTFIALGNPDQEPLVLTRSDAFAAGDYTNADLVGTWASYSNGEQGFFTDDYRSIDLYWAIHEDGTLESYGVYSDGTEYDRRTNTYTVSGNELTITNSSGESSTYYILIEGDKMTLEGFGPSDTYWTLIRQA